MNHYEVYVFSRLQGQDLFLAEKLVLNTEDRKQAWKLVKEHLGWKNAVMNDFKKNLFYEYWDGGDYFRYRFVKVTEIAGANV